jgi:hypothetical protein
MDKLKDGLAFVDFKTDLLGTEVLIKGSVRKNALFNNLELTGNDLSRVNPDELVESLEKTNS